MLFYWWPIWVLGYSMALVTYFENHRLAIVPDGSKLTVMEENDKEINYRLRSPSRRQNHSSMPNLPLKKLEKGMFSRRGYLKKPGWDQFFVSYYCLLL
jgi:hypothetical protein